MAYNFKNLADVELLEAMPEEANVLVEVNGATKRAPQAAGGSGGTFVVNVTMHYDEETGETYTSDKTTEEIASAYESGMNLACIIREEYEGETYVSTVLRDVCRDFDGGILFLDKCNVGSSGGWYRIGLRFIENRVEPLDDHSFIMSRMYFNREFFMISMDKTLWRVTMGNNGVLTTENLGMFGASNESDDSGGPA